MDAELSSFNDFPAPPLGAASPESSRPHPAVSLRFGVIGMGSVGPVLAAAWRAAGHTLVGVTARSQESRERADAMVLKVDFLAAADLAARVDLLVLTVSDSGLPGLVSQLAESGAFRAGQLVAHTAGAFGLEILAPAQAAGAIPLALHPAQTFSGTSLDLDRLYGTHWAVNAPLALLPVAQALVMDIGGIPAVLPDAARPLYHAALAHGANHLVTLVTQSLRALRVAGIENPAAFIEPLLKAALERAFHEGEAGLSGPIRRGDALTVQGHLEALSRGGWRHPDDSDPSLPLDDLSDLPGAYRAMAAATASRVYARRGLSETQYRELVAVLEEK
ncbi:MAG: DUF2520 domain-containing protein [Mobiluncus porci]|uniref:Rossmann-like and DUF2520 domain-containing protein n=1 Tax=Mobiluncus porci TaxID=2652278 RepID=UPI0023F3E2F0|nr:DUF2520 domain-containing protein [Mobiluncus porci]MDD7541336.1 DUF2520 domain-containing protein [Mobiluncus porci]MDY5747819.1 DUF2520 domain-containing protein [Mobiluncus porci]